jgi:hypothetical protein
MSENELAPRAGKFFYVTPMITASIAPRYRVYAVDSQSDDGFHARARRQSPTCIELILQARMTTT